MTAPILLTPHQCDAVSFVVSALQDGEKLAAIRGYAGTGKTSLIPMLRETITSTLDLPTAVGSPTHRAAMILRKKGIEDAGTIHSLALTPFFLADYAWAHRWLGEDCPARAGAIEERTPDILGVPYLLAKATDKPKGLMARVRRHGVKKVLASLGIHGKDYFDGFGAKQGEGVLIVDEASMVGAETLKLCQDAFSQIVLIGDPGQLPPVHDTSMLGQVVAAFDLTEIHRQAADNPIITLAYEARGGTPNWKTLPLVAGKINQSLCAEDPSVFLTAPLIVWRNETRLACTKGIRAALGYWHGKVYPGEPLVCRSTSAADRAEGLLNNSLWRISAVDSKDACLVSVYEEGKEDEPHLAVRLHLEETDGEEVPEDAVPFRFGYCLTAHTAQGGEWPVVYISKPDLLAHQAFCRTRQSDEHAQWSYTAITRAKDTLCFLQEHRFLVHEDTPTVTLCPGDTLTQPMKDALTTIIERAKEDTMPVTMTVEPETTLQVPTKAVEPLAPLTGDIDDPPVPDGTTTALEAFTAMPANGALPATVPLLPDQLLPLAHGFCQYVQAQLGKQLEDAGIKMARSMDTTITAMADYTKGVLATNEHAHYSFADALAKITAQHLPYSVVVHAVAPGGLPCTLTMHKPTSSELIEELGRMEGWLVAHGYTAQEVAA